MVIVTAACTRVGPFCMVANTARKPSKLEKNFSAKAIALHCRKSSGASSFLCFRFKVIVWNGRFGNLSL